MSIGETLAQARRQAGLTVTDVSQRTRIRETIIRGIEADDYSACGGDFYARGHIRSIAKVVGADPAPLIGEYDSVRGAPGWTSPTDRAPAGPAEAGPAEAGPAAGSVAAGKGSGPAAPDSDTDVMDALSPGGPLARGGPLASGGLTAPGGPAAPRRVNWTLVLAVALVAAVAILAYRLVPGTPRAVARTAGEQGPAHRHAARSHRPQAVASPAATRPSAGPSQASAASEQQLKPVSVTAFGPGGVGSGDNAALAPLAIDGSRATDWHTDWYTSARFGGLYTGTGLLLDMGLPVTITSVRIDLGGSSGAGSSGARFELRVGAAPDLAGLPVVAGESGAAGLASVSLATPARGRYVLIWFTSLPLDSAGTYQASVYDVTLADRA